MKLKVSNSAGRPEGLVTVKDCVTSPPPALIPVKFTVGAGSNGKFRANSMEFTEKGVPSIRVNSMTFGGPLPGAKAASAFEPA